MALTTVLSRPGAGGMTLMTAVRGDVLRIIHVERARVTVSMILTVSTQAGDYKNKDQNKSEGNPKSQKINYKQDYNWVSFLSVPQVPPSDPHV